MKGRMCSRAFAARLYIDLTETHRDGVLYCSILRTMAFTSVYKIDDLSIAAWLEELRHQLSSGCRMGEALVGQGWVYEADGGDGARSEQREREREREHILYRTLPEHPPS